MNTRLLALISALIALIALCSSSNETTLRIVSYNCENLFDTIHDEGKLDTAFTPTGSYQWTSQRYKRKLANVAAAINAAGGMMIPAIVGLCEVENDSVLEMLTRRTSLRHAHYSYIHHESPDLRGIDVALLYDAKQYRIIRTEYIHVETDDTPTREILYAMGTLTGGDTLHVFVNHWPSRRGGEIKSQNRRFAAARALRHAIDSICSTTPMPYIICIGDYNDTPSDPSISDTLRAHTDWTTPQPHELYNLTAQYDGCKELGTHKFQRRYEVLDNVIVSGAMLTDSATISTDIHMCSICTESFLFEKKRKDTPTPRRTFKGPYYTGGYSDHLPVYIELRVKN